MTNSSVEQSKIDFIQRWILGTFIGWILAIFAIFPGLGIWEIIASVSWQYNRDAQVYRIWSDNFAQVTFFLLMLATLMLMGVSVGLAQWQIALKGKISKKRWLFSNLFLIITAGIGFLISSRLSPGLLITHRGNMSGMDDYYTLKDTWLLAILIRGVVVGAFIGIPQWFILRRSFEQAHYWLFNIILASLAVFASLVAIIALVKSTLFSMSLGCCISPVVFSVVTGLGLYNLLKRIKATPL